MEVKALHLNIYRNPLFEGCSGGYTETANDIYVACEEGPCLIDANNPALFRLCGRSWGLYLDPWNQPSDLVGPMFGGNYASSSDSRFNRLCAKVLGHPFYGAVAVHDRFETLEVYEALSR